jgi:hypothetical protein
LIDKAVVARAIGEARYEDGRRLAWRTAAGTGTQRTLPQADQADREALYDIVSDVLAAAFTQDDTPSSQMRKLCELYSDFPSYTVLSRFPMEIGIDALPEREMRSYYRLLGEMLSAEADELADPVAYHLWVDLFEGTDTVDEAWVSVAAAITSQRGWRRLLEHSGPVPIDLKIGAFEAAAADPNLHEAILKALYSGLVDAYGIMDRATIEAWLPRLQIRTESSAEYARDLRKRLVDPRPINSGPAKGR